MIIGQEKMKEYGKLEGMYIFRWFCSHLSVKSKTLVMNSFKHVKVMMEVYSKVMCWVCLDRAIRLADKRSLPAPREQWIQTRDKIYITIMNEGWDEGNWAKKK